MKGAVVKSSYRSFNVAKWAAFYQAINIEPHYVGPGHAVKVYCEPDFYLSDHACWIRHISDPEANVDFDALIDLINFQRLRKEIVLLIFGPPKKFEYHIVNTEDIFKGNRSDCLPWYHFALSQKSTESELWLCDDPVCYCLHPKPQDKRIRWKERVDSNDKLSPSETAIDIGLMVANEATIETKDMARWWPQTIKR